MDEKSHLLSKNTSTTIAVRRSSFPHEIDVQNQHLPLPSTEGTRKNRSRSYNCSRRGSYDNSRMRTNSLALFNELEESMVSTVGTSYGPIVLSDDTHPGYGGLVGLAMATISGILFTVNNFLFQFFSLNVTNMLLTRSSMQVAILGLILIVTGCTNVKPNGTAGWVLVVAQSIFSGARVGLTFACLDYLPIGDALTIIFSEPLWTLILSKLFLRTKIGLWKSSFAVILLVGVLLCAQPPFVFKNFNSRLHHTPENTSIPDFVDEGVDASTPSSSFKTYLGTALAIGAAVSGALSNILVAKLETVEQISTTSLVAYSGLGGAVQAILYGLFLDEDNQTIVRDISSLSSSVWLQLLLLGGMGVVGFFTLTRSLQLMPPTTVAMIRALEIVLAYGLQAVVFGEIPNSLAMAGSLLVIVSVTAFAAENVILRCNVGRFCGLH